MPVRTTFIGEKDGNQFEIVVEIGEPYRFRDKPEEWACQVALGGLYDRLHDMHGSDAFHALCQAAGLVLSLLEAFKEDGGRIRFHDGTDVPLEAYTP